MCQHVFPAPGLAGLCTFHGIGELAQLGLLTAIRYLLVTYHCQKRIPINTSIVDPNRSSTQVSLNTRYIPILDTFVAC
jgi:hypothetical protein